VGSGFGATSAEALVEWIGFDSGPVPGGPKVVVLGGGHGLAVAVRAAREYAGSITAIVSVADDGGSSGRLRDGRTDVPAPGDLRRAIGALAAEGSLWPEVLEHRFTSGELEAHAVGNLVLVGLIDALGSITAACAELARIAGALGSVYPATMEAVTLRAEVAGGVVDGQVAIQRAAARGPVRNVRVVPDDANAVPAALGALMEADQVVIGPGSLFTSVVAAVVVPEIQTAIALTPGRVVQVGNVAPEYPETTELDGTDHLLTVLEHRVRVDTFLYDRTGMLSVNEAYVYEHGVMPVGADLGAEGGPTHDPRQLAKALADLT
jgi:uncharacterized cofD-like protein